LESFGKSSSDFFIIGIATAKYHLDLNFALINHHFHLANYYYLALNTIIMAINFQIQFSYFRYYVFLGCTSHFLCLFFLSLAEIVPYLF
jgi:hypothetical protein